MAKYERQIHTAEQSIEHCLSELFKLDKHRNWSDKESEVKLHALTEEVTELRKNF